MRATEFSYFTIAEPAEGLYKEKGSKFLAFAFPAESEVAVKERLDSVKKKYFDAKHQCYAYVLAPPENRYRAFDAGEPNHSAGDPILGKIRSKNLTNIVVIVVRYFGGVKLGVGGLVQAYKAAAEEALANAIVVEREITEEYRIAYGYAASPEVMRLVKDYDLKILRQGFAESGFMEIEVKLRNKDRFLEKMDYLRAMKAEIEQHKIVNDKC